MSSFFFGDVTLNDETYEIHAVTKDMPFHGFSVSEISDTVLFKRILQTRFDLITSGNAIYCTDICIDFEDKIEYNPHDDREGTIHILAITKQGNIVAGLSCALDTHERYNSDYIGLPLENRYKSRKGEPCTIDSFRSRYLRTRYLVNRNTKPYQLAELYRHFKFPGKNNEFVRLSLYAACFQMLYKYPTINGFQETSLWLFDTVPLYYNMYRKIGFALIRDFTIQDQPRYISPKMSLKNHLQAMKGKKIFFKDDIISRKVIIPRGYFRDDCKYSHDEVSFIDGLFDINDTLSLSAYHKGHNNDDILSVIGINEQEYDTILLHSSMLTNDEYLSEDGLMSWQYRVQRNITSGYHSGNR